MADNDKETIVRLRNALANMNKDYMQTKLELDQIKATPRPADDGKADSAVGSSLIRFSSKMKALHSNLNTKLQTAMPQINQLKQTQNDGTAEEPSDADAENDDTKDTA